MLIDKSIKQVISENIEFERIMSEGGGTVGKKITRTWTH